MHWRVRLTAVCRWSFGSIAPNSAARAGSAPRGPDCHTDPMSTTVADVELDQLVEVYAEHMVMENVPENTRKARLRTLRSVGCPGIASRELIEAWWSSRSELAPATRSNDLANLRTFYRWCSRWEHRGDDPTLRVDPPKVPNGLPRPISRADLHTLLDKLPDDLRRAVCLGAYAGLRVSEAAALSWIDVDVETRRARILGKGQKSRLVAFSPVLIDQLLPDTGGNVVTAGAEPFSAARLQRRVNRAIAAACVDATFHQLRHRYGTIAYQATGDLLAVGRQMGHSSPVTTAVYAAASDEVADQIAAAVVR
jgi:integrase